MQFAPTRSVFLQLACVLVATLVTLPGIDGLNRARRSCALDAVALYVLVGLNGLFALNRPVGLNLLVLDGDVARLDSLPALNPVRAFAELRAGLRSAQGLDAL